MSKCLKGFILETKECACGCYGCEHYESRSKKEIMLDHLTARQKRWVEECYTPSICNSCSNFNRNKAMCRDMLKPASVWFESKSKSKALGCKLSEVFITEVE